MKTAKLFFKLALIILVITNGPSLIAITNTSFNHAKKIASHDSALISMSSAQEEDANFEGTYQVGTTTCTVKPIKMAFELKWAKGKGTLIFFYDSDSPEEHPTFVSDNKDKFIFDNKQYNTGKFIRGDGKEFAVKKVR